MNVIVQRDQNNLTGLLQFIRQVRNCKTDEEEETVINQQLAKIRSKFKQKTLEGYHKKKCVCKLLFIHLLGRKIGCGFLEAVSLLSSNRYSEKQIGYTFISIMFDEKCESENLLIQCIKSDLESNNVIFMNLALKCVANIGSREMATVLSARVVEIVGSKSVDESVKQSALFCMLKLQRASKSSIPFLAVENLKTLLSNYDLGVVHAAISLMNETNNYCSDYRKNGLESVVISELKRIVALSRPGIRSHTFHAIPAPWLQINLIKLVQNMGLLNDPNTRSSFIEILDIFTKDIEKMQCSKQSFAKADIHKAHLKFAIFLEAVRILTQNNIEEYNLIHRCCKIAIYLLNHSSTSNLSYFALEVICELTVFKSLQEYMLSNQDQIINLLYTKCDVTLQCKVLEFVSRVPDILGRSKIVFEMINHLKKVDFCQREALAYHTANIAESCFQCHAPYVDVIIELISLAGDVLNDVGSRVVKIISSEQEIQKHAAKTIVEHLKRPPVQGRLVDLAATVLGEYGHLIDETDNFSVATQFKLLAANYSTSSSRTKAYLLTTFMKMATKFPFLRSLATDLFRKNASCLDIEVQKRSVEYLAFFERTPNSLLSLVFHHT